VFGFWGIRAYNLPMLARSELRHYFQTTRLAGRSAVHSARHGRLILLSLTAVYLLWLFVRFVSQPAWFSQLPDVLDELLHLAELAGFITLTLVWSVVWWQGRRQTAVPFSRETGEQPYDLNPYEFEQYVADLFRRKGYHVKLRGRSGDNGVDLLLIQPGGKRAIVQCKRYRKTVGPEIVRELYGTLIHERVSHAFLVTTADISEAAREWAQGKPMTLIDGRALAHIATQLGKL
jgi:restriction system protein